MARSQTVFVSIHTAGLPVTKRAVFLMTFDSVFLIDRAVRSLEAAEKCEFVTTTPLLGGPPWLSIRRVLPEFRAQPLYNFYICTVVP